MISMTPIMSMISKLSPRILFGALLLSSSSHALAQQSVTVSFGDDDPQPINAAFEVHLDYELDLADYQDVVIELPLPDRALFPVTTFITESSSVLFTHSSETDGFIETHRWTAAPFSTAISGRITVTVRFDSAITYAARFRTLTGTRFPFTATLSGRRRPTGDGSYTTFTPPSHTAFRTAIGAAEPELEYTGATFYGSTPATIAGTPGVVQRYVFRMIVRGNAGTRGYDWTTGTGGIPWRLDFGPAVHFLRAFAQNADAPPSSAAAPTISILTAPIPYGETNHVLGGSLTARVDRDVTPTLDWHAYSDELIVDVFLPCAGATPLTANPADHGITMTVAQAPQQVWDDPAVAGTPPDITRSLDPAVGHAQGISFGACGTGGGAVKYWNGTAGANTTVGWAMGLSPPLGASEITDALVIDRLPDGTDAVRATPAGAGDLVDFIAYFCLLPDVDFFDFDTFEDHLVSGACTPAASDGWYAVPDPGLLALGDATHVVYAAPTWGTSAPVRALSISVATHISADYAGPEYTNRIQLQGSFGDFVLGDAVIEAAPATDPYEAHATRDIVDWSCGGVSTDPAPQPSVRQLGPGGCSWLTIAPRARPNLELPRGAAIDVDVPAGVLIKKAVTPFFPAEPAPVDGIWITGACGGAGAVVAPAPADRPLHFSLCEYEDYAWNAGMPIHLEFCLDPAHLFPDGHVLDFTATFVDSDNQGAPEACPADPNYPTTATARFTVAVPPELRYFVYPTCQSDGGAAFIGQALNSGGQDLTHVALTLKIPAGATFAGVDQITNAPGAIVQVSATDPPGPTDWVGEGGIPAASVRWARLVGTGGLTLPALTGQPVSFRVRLDTTGAGGQALTSAGAAYANELSQPASATPSAFVIESCAWLEIYKFHDADGDGAQGPGEIDLNDWPFTVSSAGGVIVGQGTTDADGALAFFLPSGVYTVTESLPDSSAGPPIWSPTTPIAAPSVTQSLTLAGEDASLDFGNTCACPSADLCELYPCLVTAGAFDTQAECATAPVAACDDGNACSQDTCNPSTGQCTNTPPSCATIDYFVPVTTAGVLGGHIRCALQAGAPPICDMQDGKLRIYPGGPNLCAGP